MQSKYEIELWSRQGVMIADISPFVKNFSYSMQRSEAEQLQLSIDLNVYEKLANDIGTHPLAMLGPYQTDIKVKRYGEYLFGSHVGYIGINLEETTATIEVRAFGYLNLLIDRYVTKSYTATDSIALSWDLIVETQAQDNGDLGFTLGPDQTTSVPMDRDYVRQNVKEAWVANSVINNYGFRITHDRKINTYDTLGTDYSATVSFVYPGNITSVSTPRDGLALSNKIYGLGSGFGEEALQSTQRDEDSELNYGVHEKISTYNSATNLNELDDSVLSELNVRKSLLELPQMRMSGEFFDLNTYGVGDRVNFAILGHPFLATVSGVYRIEKLDVSVDENEAEQIGVTFDNYGLTE